eukprot:9503614-Pyramimonas_sp.AAC.1
MPILGIPLFFEGESLRLSSPFGVSILGVGIRSRLVRHVGPFAEGTWAPRRCPERAAPQGGGETWHRGRE